VDSLAIFKQDNAQGSIAHFWNARPSANSIIRLFFFSQRMLKDAFDPFFQNNYTIWALASKLKVLRCFHFQTQAYSQIQV